MCNLGQSSVPNEFLDVLNDEEFDSDDDVVEEIDESRYEDLVAELESLDLQRQSQFIVVQEDSSLAPVAMPEPGAGVVASDSDENSESNQDHIELLRT